MLTRFHNPWGCSQEYFQRFFQSLHRTLGRMTMKSTRRGLGHLLLRSLVRSHRSLIRLLLTARFARAHSFARSLTHSLQSSWDCGFCLQNERVGFISFEPTVQCQSGKDADHSRALRALCPRQTTASSHPTETHLECNTMTSHSSTAATSAA